MLLLDEPTSGLDAVLERRLMHLFRRQADHGRAVLVATHASASLDLCNEVVVLEAGGIAFRGSPADAQLHLAAVANDLGRDSDLESVLATVPTTPERRNATSTDPSASSSAC